MDLQGISAAVGFALEDKGLWLATAESCTGGMVASSLTEVPGSSRWFDRGFVTYSNESKIELLGVDSLTLEKFGAVSEETARAMAQGALERSRADICLSVTGIAGPSGGSIEKPVGTVCFAWAHQSFLESQTRHFEGGRHEVRIRSVRYCLQELLSFLP